MYSSKESSELHVLEKFGTLHRACGLMDKALVFGTKDCRFETCQGQSYCQRRLGDALRLNCECLTVRGRCQSH